MRLPKLLMSTLLILTLIGGVTQAANSSSITVGWTLPTRTISNGDCAVAGYTIPADKPIIVRVQWRVRGTATWQHADTADRAVRYTITSLPAETAYEIRFGPHYGTGAVTCWSNVVLATTPALEPPQGCTDGKVIGVQ